MKGKRKMNREETIDFIHSSESMKKQLLESVSADWVEKIVTLGEEKKRIVEEVCYAASGILEEYFLEKLDNDTKQEIQDCKEFMCRLCSMNAELIDSAVAFAEENGLDMRTTIEEAECYALNQLFGTDFWEEEE